MTEETQNEAKPDPPQMYDMREDLQELRELLTRRGYTRQQSSGAGEVWIETARRYRVTLLADPTGRIRAEIRNPAGAMYTEISPAYPVDVEKALP